MSINKDFLLNNLKYDFDIKVYDSVSSTNTLLKELAINGAKEGTIIIASHQSAGRGRMGRTFYSPAESGIYMSLLLRPNLLAKDALSLTTMTAVSVANAIDKLSDKEALIKWVNDIYIDNKKVCGILAESAINSDGIHLDYVVVGIGINLTMPMEGFPKDIKHIASPIFNSNSCVSKELLISEILNNMMNRYNNDTTNNYIEEYVNKSFIIGKEIYLLTENLQKKATAIAIDNACRLKVEYPDGSTQWLSSGEVSTQIIDN